MVVTGSGRSGTSTVTGALARLGLDVPGPLAPPDERNPKGFYETPWVIERNGRVLESLPVRGNDARPEAGALADAAADDPELVADLHGWLVERVAGHAQSVVKDPQIFWLHRAWRAAAAQAGVDLSFVTMLRHPVEVARSRDTAYLTGKDAEHRRVREISNVAAWCNAAYLTEQNTRGAPRAFVRYDDLLADWRRALTPLQEQVDIRLDPARRTVTRAGTELDLARKEFGVLHALMAAGGDAVNTEELLASVWDANVDPFSNIVRMTVMKLRRKLGEPGVIDTVPGVGYRM